MHSARRKSSYWRRRGVKVAHVRPRNVYSIIPPAGVPIFFRLSGNRNSGSFPSRFVENRGKRWRNEEALREMSNEGERIANYRFREFRPGCS